MSSFLQVRPTGLGLHNVASASARPARPSQICRAAAPPNLEKPTATVKEEQVPGAFFVATNNFNVKPERAGDFETRWKTRDTHLKGVPGFIRFALLRGDAAGEYISMSTWNAREDFDNWRESPQFRMAHEGKPKDQEQQQQSKRESMGEMLQGPPQPKLYEAVTTTEASLL
ncbi:hypothetical protein WJX73_006371 [Symbiochloris irregularis]|uniref:ABM domain-containing protein n=1 Tax=Symbiochloris irregularis TaxID=706552 RepID=A0AAW1P7H5_9CHLO